MLYFLSTEIWQSHGSTRTNDYFFLLKDSACLYQVQSQRNNCFAHMYSSFYPMFVYIIGNLYNAWKRDNRDKIGIHWRYYFARRFGLFITKCLCQAVRKSSFQILNWWVKSRNISHNRVLLTHRFITYYWNTYVCFHFPSIYLVSSILFHTCKGLHQLQCKFYRFTH